MIPRRAHDDRDTLAGPHPFEPLAFRDRFGQRGRCRGCYRPRYAHPIRDWTPARSIGDRRPAEPEALRLGGARRGYAEALWRAIADAELRLGPDTPEGRATVTLSTTFARRVALALAPLRLSHRPAEVPGGTAGPLANPSTASPGAPSSAPPGSTTGGRP